METKIGEEEGPLRKGIVPAGRTCEGGTSVGRLIDEHGLWKRRGERVVEEWKDV